jgi:hypothetical protein
MTNVQIGSLIYKKLQKNTIEIIMSKLDRRRSKASI